MTTELKTYKESAGEFLEEIYLKAEFPADIKELTNDLIPLVDSLFSTRDFAGDELDPEI